MNRTTTPKWLIALTLLLIVVDLSFICLQLAFEWGWFSDPKFCLFEEWSYAEWDQYFKYYWIAVIFGLLLADRKELVYFVGSALFTYLLLDDSLRIHENVGKLIVVAIGWGPQWNSHFNLRNQDYGELLVSMLAGGTFLLMLVKAYRRGSRQARGVCIRLVLWLATLGFFGVFFDMLSIALGESELLVLVLSLIEDGGEMIVASLIVLMSTRLLVLNEPAMPRPAEAPATIETQPAN